jgi:hypothetical protein
MEKYEDKKLKERQDGEGKKEKKRKKVFEHI